MAAEDEPDVRISYEKADRYERQQAILELMESRHMKSILLYVDETEPVLKTDIYRDVAAGGSLREKLDILQDLGLIDAYTKPGARPCYMALTPKGRRVVATIRLMLQIIDDGPDGRRRSGRKGGERLDKVTEDDLRLTLEES